MDTLRNTKTALTETVEIQSEITLALRIKIMDNCANGVVVDTVVLQRELRRFCYNASASVNFKINNYGTF